MDCTSAFRSRPSCAPRLTLRCARFLLALLPVLAPACSAGTLEPQADAATEILLSASALDMAPGDTVRLHATLLGRNGAPLLPPSAGTPKPNPVSWSSSRPELAAVDGKGLVMATDSGDAVITATSGTLKSSAKVKIRGAKATKVSKVTVSPDSGSLTSIGDTLQLAATVLDDQGNTLSNASITWSSLNPEIASVNGSGRVVSRAAGVALVTAVSGGLADTAVVDVEQVVASVAVSPSAATLAVADSLRLTATAVDAKGVAVAGATFTWSSSSPAIATVSADGLVKGVAAGAATIRASVDGHASSSTVTVEAASGGPTPSTWIFPGDNIQSKVDSHPAGTAFYIKAGVHRMQRVRPKDGNSFIGEPGAVLSGARLLTQFVREGSYWVATGQTQQGQTIGMCAPHLRGTTRDTCMYPEDLFIDDRMLEQVTALSAVGPGTWYFDYGADKIYFVDDPSGRKVETSVTRHAFEGSASGVTIRALTVEKYANPAQHGAVHSQGADGSPSSNWIVDDNVVRWNHGVGIRIGHRMQVRRNKVHHNGQLGIGGVGDDVVVEENEIAFNNTAGFSWGWEGGGTKFVRTQRLLARGNHVHRNEGPGLWTDGYNIYTTYENNRVEHNFAMGIFHEISYDAVVRNNHVEGNGFGQNHWLYGAGILIAHSPNVEVYGNVVKNNANGIAGIQQRRTDGEKHGLPPHLLSNLHVHNNTVTMTVGRSGIADDTGETDVWTSRNNRFEANTYYLGSNKSYFHWSKAWSNESEWQGFKNDLNGKFIR